MTDRAIPGDCEGGETPATREHQPDGPRRRVSKGKRKRGPKSPQVECGAPKTIRSLTCEPQPEFADPDECRIVAGQALCVAPAVPSGPGQLQTVSARVPHTSHANGTRTTHPRCEREPAGESGLTRWTCGAVATYLHSPPTCIRQLLRAPTAESASDLASP